MNRRFLALPLLALAAVLPVHGALAQDAKDQGEAERDDDFHGEIVVTGVAGISRLDFLAGTSVVQASELQQNLDGQIGEVLAKLPGVSASGFSPGASRPVLRGFSGERVRVLVDGIGSIDVSNTSADHAVTIDPLTSDRIEVLRGPAVMLYGSQAIGGAVNVIDKRIPISVPDEGAHIDGVLGLDTAANRREAGASVDVPLGQTAAVHFDGSWRKTDDLQVPGFVASGRLRAELIADAEALAGSDPAAADELRSAADLRGRLPDSWTETTSLGAGVTLFSGDSNIGVSGGYYDTSYGVPVKPGGGESGVSIGLTQYRADLRGKLDLGEGFFESVNTRWGYSDYTHSEFEGADVGTTFAVTGVEGRFELVQTPRDDWRGTIGGQFYHRDFNAFGEEAYIAPNTTDQFAVFALQEVDVGPLELELAGRYERAEVKSQAFGLNLGFDSVSGALGISRTTEENLRFGINLSRAQRAPSAEELFADGAHIATQQFEIGDTGLGTEKALGIEAYVRGPLGPVDASLAVFQSWFSDYIYLAATGMEEDGLPVYQQRQADARYFGIEGEMKFPILDGDEWDIGGEVRGDYIRASLEDGTPLPRIPPVSLLGALDVTKGLWNLRGEVEWSARQDRIAPLETPTDGFVLTNLALSWKPEIGRGALTVMLQADNLFDVDARRHTSFTKEFVPMAGRNVRLSARVSL